MGFLLVRDVQLLLIDKSANLMRQSKKKRFLTENLLAKY
jgi:hypothetical protein